jgi:serine-type D-Ala-D-Ala carboxypeptidase (penicillin-binding protein 5/6)
MPSVLQPVDRRQRRRRRTYRRRRLTVLALVVAASAYGAMVARGHRDRAIAPPPAAAAAAPITVRNAPRSLVPEPLVSGTPTPHAFSPPIGGRSAILVDASTGKVIWALRPHEELPIASLTKIMTATLVLQRLPLSTIVHIGWTVPRVPLVREGLRAGEDVEATKLLDSLLLYSGNDDALALAIATAGGRKAFIALMNREAGLLGLRNTHYNSTSGVIDQDNYSSAWDLAALTRYAREDPRFRAIVRTRVKHVSWSAPIDSKTYVNKNKFLWLYPGANGVKTGWTTLAGWCVVETATRHGKTLLAVVINSPRPYNDAARLLNFGYAELS